MRDVHEPRNEFVDRLEMQIGHDIRQRNRAAEVPRWMPRSHAMAAAALVAVIVVSMGTGAVAVAAAYQTQNAEQRDQLTSSLQQRAVLAQQGVAIVNQEMAVAQQQVSTGLADKNRLMEVRVKVADAEAQLRAIQLQIEEVRLTAREPRVELSAPRVSGRDFVSERLQIEMSVPQVRLELAEAQLVQAQYRFSIGMVDSISVEEAHVGVLEADLAIQTLRKKLDIRQKFLSGVMDAVETDLRALEADADQHRSALAQRLELARKNEAQIARRVQVGAAQLVDGAQAKLQRLQLEYELSKADLDLALVRRQIEQHRAGK